MTYDGTLGTLRLAGLVQDIRPAPAVSGDYAVGWAIGASGLANVPFGTNTKIGFNAQYTEGIIQFLHEDTTVLPVADFAVNATGSETRPSKGWSASLGLSTEIFPRTKLNFTGGYTDIHQYFGAIDVSWYDLAANIEYRLTDALTLTAEAHYRNLEATGLPASDGLTTLLRAQLEF